MAIAEGIQRAIQLYSVLQQQQMARDAAERQKRRLTLEEEIRREDLKLRKKQDARAELKEKQGQLAALDEEEAAEIYPRPGGGFEADLGIPGGPVELSKAETPASRVVQVGEQHFLRRPPAARFERSIEREAKKQAAVNKITLPSLEAGQPEITMDRRGIGYLLGELNRRAAVGRQVNQQQFQAGQGKLRRESAEQIAQKNRESRERVARTPRKISGVQQEKLTQQKDVERLTNQLLTASDNDPAKAKELLRLEMAKPGSAYRNYALQISRELLRLAGRGDEDLEAAFPGLGASGQKRAETGKNGQEGAKTGKSFTWEDFRLKHLK